MSHVLLLRSTFLGPFDLSSAGTSERSTSLEQPPTTTYRPHHCYASSICIDVKVSRLLLVLASQQSILGIYLFERPLTRLTDSINNIIHTVIIGPMSVQFLNWRYAVMMRSDAMSALAWTVRGTRPKEEGWMVLVRIPWSRQTAMASLMMELMSPRRCQANTRLVRIHLGISLDSFIYFEYTCRQPALLLHLLRSASDGLPMPRCPLNRTAASVWSQYVVTPAGRCRLAPSRSGLHRLIHSMARACGWGGRRRGVGIPTSKARVTAPPD